jgi:hypothetical protein
MPLGRHNMRALGMPVVEGASSLDLTVLIQDLGDYSKRRRQDLIVFMRENNILERTLPVYLWCKRYGCVHKLISW